LIVQVEVRGGAQSDARDEARGASADVSVGTGRQSAARAGNALRRLVPGLLLAGAGAAAGFVVHALAPGVPVVLVAVILGVLVANLVGVPAVAQPGLRFAAGALMKTGIVLLGFELVFQQILGLGARGLSVVVVVVVVTFFGTQWAGRLLGVSPGLSLLVASGFSICGVSAIAAAREASGADDEEVAYAIALVTLCGSLSILVLPALHGVLGLDDRSFGAWVGASVHDVAQVVAASSVVGGAAVAAAVVVKLARVVLLGPVVAWISWTKGRGAGVAPSRLVPWFVFAFIGAALLRSAGVVPSGALPPLADAKLVLLAVALFAVGARVEVRKFAAVGVRPLVLALGSWAIVAAVAYAGVRAVWM
jgi:uncharacterized integral membrane protein (TIGR00698 family)